jgi:hypothetical protein
MGTMTQGEFADALLFAHRWNNFLDDDKEAKKQFITGIPGYDRATPITRQVAATMIQNLSRFSLNKPIK